MCNKEKCQCKCKQECECECKHPKFDRMAGLMFHHNWVRLARMNDEIRLKLNSMIAERDRLNADIAFFEKVDHFLNHELNSMKCLDSRQEKDNSPELERQAALYL